MWFQFTFGSSDEFAVQAIPGEPTCPVAGLAEYVQAVPVLSELGLDNGRCICLRFIRCDSVYSVLLYACYLARDHPRDQAGKHLYYAGTFWLYFQSH